MAEKRGSRQPDGGRSRRPADGRGRSSVVRPKSSNAESSKPSASRPKRPAAGSGHPSERKPVVKRDESARTILSLYRADMAKILADTDAPSFRYAQVLEHLMRRPGVPLTEASNLPEEVRAALEPLGTSVLEVVSSRRASDATTKLLLAARDGALIETVAMPYGNRLTVCVSSQAGCPVGCVFCATGALGLRRNLSTAEIVDQLRATATVYEPGQRLTNVVYMGMGEPLLNLGAVLDSVRVLTAPSGRGLGHRSLAVSTVGIPSGIVRLARTEPQVNLALSLHAADDATRALLIPDRFRHPLEDILEAAWEHFEITRRKLLVEYVLIEGVNDSVDDARRLAALLRGHVVTVNLLAWNPVVIEDRLDPGSPTGAGTKSRQRRIFRPSHPAAIAAFRAALRASHIEAVVRQSKGAGIEAACGQLAGTARSYPEPGPTPR